jgi:hypothetical protein
MKNKTNILRKVTPRFFRLLLRKLYANQFKFGFSPLDLISLSPIHKFSLLGKNWNVEYVGGWGGWIPVNNHSKGYHGLLAQWWDIYGLGKKCLLVSETKNVASTFEKLYPNTTMISTDYYIDLLENGETDYVWNLYQDAPNDLASIKFDSIICQATLEHLMDPVGVIKRLTNLLEVAGHIYIHTHTPLYPYHNWPSDYLRYFPDWFRDLKMVIPEIEMVELYCKEGHVFATYKKIK